VYGNRYTKTEATDELKFFRDGEEIDILFDESMNGIHYSSSFPINIFISANSSCCKIMI
jgi:hypothetical protein